MSAQLSKMCVKNKPNFEQQKKKKKKIDLHTLQEWVDMTGLRLSLLKPDYKVSL